MKLHFLKASVPLTKQVTAQGKEPYPHVKHFTSVEEDIPDEDVAGFYQAIKTHAAQGHCLGKGTLARPLKNEPRAGATSARDLTSWLCLDFDRFRGTNITNILQTLGFNDTSYILQYTASHDPATPFISAHVFVLLAKPVLPAVIKEWLQAQNLRHFQDQIALNPGKTSLHWPLDITTCQNDKLIYIAPPIFKPVSLDPFPKREPRILLVKRKSATHTLNFKFKQGEAQNDAHKLMNELRRAEGLAVKRTSTKFSGGKEVLVNPTPCMVTNVIERESYWQLDLNGGDSHAYLVNKNNPDWLFDFKTQAWAKTAELVPEFYRDIMEKRTVASQVTDEGTVLLGFCNRFSGEYFIGSWSARNSNLEINKAKTGTQVYDWFTDHDMSLGDHIPTMDIIFDPHQTHGLDETSNRINLFKPSQYMELKSKNNDNWPSIKNLIMHVLGAQDATLFQHFINWLACVFQHKPDTRPLTAWVLHGTEGTGKGYLFSKVLTPLLGPDNVIEVNTKAISGTFNTWAHKKLLVFADEIDSHDFDKNSAVAATLRSMITEDRLMLRAMHQDMVNVKNHASYIFASNRPQPVYIPEDDRRYNVGEYQGKKLPRPVDKVIESELEAFAQHLLAHKIDIEQACGIIDTAARSEIIKLGHSSAHEICRCIKTGNFSELWDAMDGDPYDITPGQYAYNNEKTLVAQQYKVLMHEIAKSILKSKSTNFKLRRDEIGLILKHCVGNVPDSPNKLTSYLRHNDINVKYIKIGEKSMRGIVTTWEITAEFRAELLKNLPKSYTNLKRVK